MPTDTRSFYMGAPVEITELRNGALTNAKGQLQKLDTMYAEPQIEQIAPGVTVLGGMAFVNCVVIEGQDGLIVYDTGENLDEGEKLLAEIRKFSDKPVVAIMYSHSHYFHGASALAEGRDGVQIIGHPNVNRNSDARGSSYYEEVLPLQRSRAVQQFARFLPDAGPMAPAGANITIGRSGYLPVNTPVSDGQTLTISGVEMTFYTAYGSDTDDCLTVHLPKHNIVLNNLLWPFLPNIYTLRGAKYRDPREWTAGLELIRDLAPDILVSTHTRVVHGRETVAATLQDAIDALRAILDQTLRGILHGLGPDELRDFVKLPAHLAEQPYQAENYGEVSHYGPYIYNHALGWFDGDAATINPVSKADEAHYLVEAMGGSRAVLQKAREALERKEFAWSAQLATYLYRLEPSDRTVRAVKADALEQMGRVTPAQTTRNWYMTQALALRGEAPVQRLIFPDEAALLRWTPASTMDQFRVRIDPERCPDRPIHLTMNISDKAVRHGWHMRRGVVEFVEDLAARRLTPDVGLDCTHENWVRFFACRIDLKAFLAACSLTHGTMADAEDFFGVFDVFHLDTNRIVPV